MTAHVVQAIHFRKGIPGEDAPMDCSCGEWSGMAGDFWRHRQLVQADKSRAGAKRQPFKVKL